MKIQGAIALVTGANRGLGKALVTALLEAGAAKVYAAARGARQSAVADARVVPLRLDTTSAAQIATAAGQAKDVTLLVNNAGVLTSFDVLTATPEALDADFRTNALGTLGVIKGFLPVLERARDGATIVNVLSLASLAAVPPMGGYSASKAAAYAITQALRPTLRAKRIEVLAALPGPIDTDMVKDIALPKASAVDVAAALVAGIERGDDEIYPDPMSQQMSALWTTSPKLLERALASGASFTTMFTVPQSPDEVYAAINDPRRWWSQAIVGDTNRIDAQWTYSYQNVHRANFRVTHLVPGKRVVWHVEDNHFNFVKDPAEWAGNDLVFEIERDGDATRVRFTQIGLVPTYECYEVCATAWTSYVTGSLRNLITTGEGQPNPIEEIVAQAREMRGPAFSTSFTVDRSPDEVFAAINDVRAWWRGDIEGTTDALGAEFTYRYADLHRTTQKITEWVPGKKVVWHVVASHINFVRDKGEWHDTDIVFEIAKKGRRTEVRFTHEGLVPAVECYDQCSAAWSHYINDSLFRWISRA